jgi:predicted ArsR family transcriptional regulator
MKFPRWTKRLLDSTRGQVILLLREEPRTVADLAAALEVTDNAIRAHLVTLERDGLVHQRGERAGFRKPHFSYELTKEAEELFPKAYAPVLAHLLTVLKEQLGRSQTEALLAEVGRRMAPTATTQGAETLEERLERVLQTLGRFGGQATIKRENGTVIIANAGCPLSAATETHPEVCQMVGAFLSEVAGVAVRCACQQSPEPRCRFEIEVVPGKRKGTKD